MTWEIIYFIIAILCCRQAYNFYCAKDGNLRKASIWVYISLAFLCIILPTGKLLNVNSSIIGFIGGTPLLFAIVYLTIVIELDIKRNAKNLK